MKSAPGPKLRWGIVGAGNIGRYAIAPAIRASSNGVLAAVASRSIERAREIARGLIVPKACTYAELLADPAIDAVYIGTPNGSHEEHAIAALDAGKHVLCEKSLALEPAAALRVRAAAERNGLRLMEAFMYRHHPQWDRIRRRIAEGGLGTIRSMQAIFANNLDRDTDHRWSAEMGGGALYDLTCYGINVCRFILGAEPQQVIALADMTPQGVDRTSHATLLFPGNVICTAVGSLTGQFRQLVAIIGSEGTMIVHSPFVPGFEPAVISIARGVATEEIIVNGANHYLHQVEHFAMCALDAARPLGPAEDGVDNVAACARARESMRENAGRSLG